jgi:hypothetical protein
MDNLRTRHLLNEDDLKSWLGFSRRLDLERHLQSCRIPYIYGKGGRICTTIAAIDKILIGGKEFDRFEEIEFL